MAINLPIVQVPVLLWPFLKLTDGIALTSPAASMQASILCACAGAVAGAAGGLVVFDAPTA